MISKSRSRASSSGTRRPWRCGRFSASSRSGITSERAVMRLSHWHTAARHDQRREHVDLDLREARFKEPAPHLLDRAQIIINKQKGVERVEERELLEALLGEVPDAPIVREPHDRGEDERLRADRLMEEADRRVERFHID